MFRLQIGRKGDETLTNMLQILSVIAILLILAFRAVNIILGAVDLYVMASPKVVAMDMGSLITASGAATDSVTIFYPTTAEVTYGMTISDKVVSVTSSYEQNPYSSKTCVSIGNTNIENAVAFTIKKSRQNGQTKYEVSSIG